MDPLNPKPSWYPLKEPLKELLKEALTEPLKDPLKEPLTGSLKPQALNKASYKYAAG